MRRIFSAQHDQFLIQHYPIWGAVRCAEALGVKAGQVRSRMGYLRQTGVTTATVDPMVIHGLLRRPKPERPEKVSSAQFEVVTDPRVAYLLGLLWADGHIDHHESKRYMIMINMVAEDLTCVEPVFDSTGAWNKYVSPKKEARTQRTFKTSNRRLTRFLSEQGYTNRSGLPRILSRIPRNLWPHWFRGLMDGDGCFYVGSKGNSASVCGPSDQDWSYLTDVMEQVGVLYTVRVTGDESGARSAVAISDLRSISRWGDYIYATYEDDRIGLPRKWEKRQQLKQRYEQSNWWKTRGHSKPDPLSL